MVDLLPGQLEEPLAEDPRNIWCLSYGLDQFHKLFTPRQLATMVSISDLTKTVGQDVQRDALNAGLSVKDSDAYSHAVTTFLALALDRCADFNNALCRWSSSNQKVMNLFGRQAIPMMWDFAEANILADSVGGWSTCSDYVGDCIEVLTGRKQADGHARQIDAATGADGLNNLLVSTDPPYYDNIPYSNLADFFYVWLRRTIGNLYPNLFSTMLDPKVPELTAAPERFNGDKQKAKEHFESGFRHAFTALRQKMDPRFPLTVYYAFKQADEDSGGDEKSDADDEGGMRVDLTTGWETLLQALIASGFQITATWPVRASQAWRMRAMGANALASYIILTCRPRHNDAPTIDRRSFVAELKRELPAALRHLLQGNIAPVDFAQAAIGPGMGIYSRYNEVLESKGTTMTVRTALSLINNTLTEVLSEQEDEFDASTQWAIAWFAQHGFGEGDFGNAELLTKAKVTSVEGLRNLQIIHSKGGKVRLLHPKELPTDWDPSTAKKLTIWGITHHLLRVYFHEKAGDERTADLLRKLSAQGSVARDLAYRLFDVCEKRKWSQEGQAYNALVLGWSEIARLARESGRPTAAQGALFGESEE
jgi:putative DNA methylase